MCVCVCPFAVLSCVQLIGVHVTGLKGQMEFNKLPGVILGWAEDKGRYEVKIDHAKLKILSLRPANTQLDVGVVCMCAPPLGALNFHCTHNDRCCLEMSAFVLALKGFLRSYS